MEALAWAENSAPEEFPPVHGVLLLALEYFYFIGERRGLPLHLHRVGKILAEAVSPVPFALISGPN